MKVTRKTYPDLLPRIVLWSVVIVVMALISILKNQLGIARAEIAAGIVLLFAFLTMLLMRWKVRRRARR
jgi:hypothetical protein